MGRHDRKPSGKTQKELRRQAAARAVENTIEDNDDPDAIEKWGALLKQQRLQAYSSVSLLPSARDVRGAFSDLWTTLQTSPRFSQQRVEDEASAPAQHDNEAISVQPFELSSSPVATTLALAAQLGAIGEMPPRGTLHPGRYGTVDPADWLSKPEPIDPRTHQIFERLHHVAGIPLSKEHVAFQKMAALHARPSWGASTASAIQEGAASAMASAVEYLAMGSEWVGHVGTPTGGQDNARFNHNPRTEHQDPGKARGGDSQVRDLHENHHGRPSHALSEQWLMLDRELREHPISSGVTSRPRRVAAQPELIPPSDRVGIVSNQARALDVSRNEIAQHAAVPETSWGGRDPISGSSSSQRRTHEVAPRLSPAFNVSHVPPEYQADYQEILYNAGERIRSAYEKLDSPVLNFGRFINETMLAPLIVKYGLDNDALNLTSAIEIRGKASDLVNPASLSHQALSRPGKYHSFTLFQFLCREYLRDPFVGFLDSQLEFRFPGSWTEELIGDIRALNVEDRYMESLEAYGKLEGVKDLYTGLLRNGIMGALNIYVNQTRSQYKSLAQSFLDVSSGKRSRPPHPYQSNSLKMIDSFNSGYAWMLNRVAGRWAKWDRVVQNILFLPASAESMTNIGEFFDYGGGGLREIEGVLISQNATSGRYECHEVKMKCDTPNSNLSIELTRRIDMSTPVAGEEVTRNQEYNYYIIPSNFSLSFFPVLEEWGKALYDSKMKNLRLDADFWAKSPREQARDRKWMWLDSCSSLFGLLMPFVAFGPNMGRIGTFLGHWATSTAWTTGTTVLPNLIQAVDADRESEASEFLIGSAAALFWEGVAAVVPPTLAKGYRTLKPRFVKAWKTGWRHMENWKKNPNAAAVEAFTRNPIGRTDGSAIKLPADGVGHDAFGRDLNFPWIDEEQIVYRAQIDRKNMASLIDNRLDLKPYASSPKFRDLEAVTQVNSLLRNEGYETEFGAMYLWKNLADIWPEVHYAIRGRTSGGEWTVIDLTANKWGTEPRLITSELEWLTRIHDNLSKQLVSHRWYKDLPAAQHEYGLGHMVPATMSDYQKTIQPDWYREFGTVAHGQKLAQDSELDQLMRSRTEGARAVPSPNSDDAASTYAKSQTTMLFEQTMDLTSRARLNVKTSSSHIREALPSGKFGISNDFIVVSNYKKDALRHLVPDDEIKGTLNAFSLEYRRLLDLATNFPSKAPSVDPIFVKSQIENYRLGSEMSRDMLGSFNVIGEPTKLSYSYFVLLRKSETGFVGDLLGGNRIYGIASITIYDDPFSPGIKNVLMHHLVMHPHVAAHRHRVPSAILSVEPRFAISGGERFLGLNAMNSMRWKDMPGAKIRIYSINPDSGRIAAELKMSPVTSTDSLPSNKALSPSGNTDIHPSDKVNDRVGETIDSGYVLMLSTWLPTRVREKAAEWIKSGLPISSNIDTPVPPSTDTPRTEFVGLDLRGIRRGLAHGQIGLTNFAARDRFGLTVYPLEQIDRAVDDALASAQWSPLAEQGRANATSESVAFEDIRASRESKRLLRDYRQRFLQTLADDAHVPIVLGIRPSVRRLDKNGMQRIAHYVDRADIEVIIVPEGLADSIRALLREQFPEWSIPVGEASPSALEPHIGPRYSIDLKQLEEDIVADTRCDQWLSATRKDGRAITSGLLTLLSEWGYDRAEIRTFLLSPRDGSKDAII
ncbi:hypothetical protein DF158_34875, partial [Burkholderia stagnalis]